MSSNNNGGNHPARRPTSLRPRSNEITYTFCNNTNSNATLSNIPFSPIVACPFADDNRRSDPPIDNRLNNIFSQPSESLLQNDMSTGDGAPSVPSAPSSLPLVQRVGTNFPEGTEPVSTDQHGIYFRVPGFEELQYYKMDQFRIYWAYE